jgi:hypothetical protein
VNREPIRIGYCLSLTGPLRANGQTARLAHHNSIGPAMPLVMENERYFVGLMGLGVNDEYHYSRFFAMIPTGSDPSAALTEGFFEAASRQEPKPHTIAILAADADFTKNPIAGARANGSRFGFEVVSETRYGLATADFVPVLKVLGPDDPTSSSCARTSMTLSASSARWQRPASIPSSWAAP